MSREGCQTLKRGAPIEAAGAAVLTLLMPLAAVRGAVVARLCVGTFER
jgi:hypothetical protein